MKNKTLLSICGPTAIGKTALAIDLAKEIKTEIISNDSRQFYKELKIGTAPPTALELATVKHHFIQHLSIQDNYSVGDFERAALDKLEKLFKLYDTVIMVGGSGLYERAVTTGLDKFPEIKNGIRATLIKQYNELGINYLQKLLFQKDPLFYTQVDIQNPQRIIRALEVCLSSGKPYSHYRQNQQKDRNFKILKIGLHCDRTQLYNQINQRVDIMFEMGLIEEATQYYPMKHYNALQTVGYRELFAHLDGLYTLDIAREEIKKNTRHFAKRQLTWFKKDSEIQWFLNHELNKIKTYVKNNIS